MKEYSVLQRLPDDREKCLCFGHKTFCCKEDMEKEPEWHRVVFRFLVSSYCLKKEFPKDIEESILERCEVVEEWECVGDEPKEHVIGVTKWKKLND